MMLPITIGSALRLESTYAVLSVITFLFLLAAIEIAQYLGGNRLRLLLTTREKGALADSLAEQNFRFDSALANMPHGLCMFDRQHRLMVWNKRFCDVYRIAPEALAPGITLRNVIELSVSRGNHPDRTAAEMVAEYEDRSAAGVPSHSTSSRLTVRSCARSQATPKTRPSLTQL